MFGGLWLGLCAPKPSKYCLSSQAGTPGIRYFGNDNTIVIFSNCIFTPEIVYLVYESEIHSYISILPALGVIESARR